MSSTTGQRRYIRVSQQRQTKLRWPENRIENQNVHRRRSSSSSESIYIRVYTSEADSHKPGIYGVRVRAWVNECGVFYCTPSRGGRGRRGAVDIFRGVFLSVWWNFVFLLFVFSTSNEHGLLQVRGNLALCTSLPVTRRVKREARSLFFLVFQGKESLFITGHARGRG